jgi:outer membrane biosynthesis protein TonB
VAENPAPPSPASAPTIAADVSQPQPPSPNAPTPQPVAAANVSPPMARTRVELQVPRGPIVVNTRNAGMGGLEAADARFSKYGEYLERMAEAIASAWDLSCDKYSFTAQDINSEVEVVFSLNSKGEVTDLEVHQSSATQGATLLCVNAVQSRAPYGPWTKEMVAELGANQVIRFTFWYR